MLNILTERKYIECKNKIVKDLYKILQENDKKLILCIHKDKIEMMLATVNATNKKLINMHIKSYREYLYNINEPQITISYMNTGTQYNIYSSVITKIGIENLIARYNNKDLQCNICLEKKKYKRRLFSLHI